MRPGSRVLPTKEQLRRLPWKARYVYAANAASEARRLALLATNTHADVRIAKPVRLGPGFRLFMPEGGSFIVHPGCDFRRDFVCEIYGGGTVEIGPGTTFTSSALLQITTRLTIGARAAFGQATLIVDGNHRWRDPDVHMFDQGYDYTPLDVGDGAMVFTKSTIFASLGERAIVGANSLVSKPVPAYCFAAGTPARVIEYYGHPEHRPPDLEVG
jgi:acetyltransferase-like isoleucine patch superfamily enzyme